MFKCRVNNRNQQQEMNIMTQGSTTLKNEVKAEIIDAEIRTYYGVALAAFIILATAVFIISTAGV